MVAANGVVDVRRLDLLGDLLAAIRALLNPGAAPSARPARSVRLEITRTARRLVAGELSLDAAVAACLALGAGATAGPRLLGRLDGLGGLRRLRALLWRLRLLGRRLLGSLLRDRSTPGAAASISTTTNNT